MSKKHKLDDNPVQRVLIMGIESYILSLLALANFIPLFIFVIVWYELNFSNWLCYLIITILILNIFYFLLIAGELINDKRGTTSPIINDWRYKKVSPIINIKGGK